MRKILNTLGALLMLCTIVFSLSGCGSSGSSDTGSWWGGGDSGGGTTTAPQVQTLTNLNNPGQPIRQGDWTQINGTGFGSTQGAGYVLYTLENGATGNADQYSQWTDTQITCRVPVTIPMGIKGKATWGAQVFTDNGQSSNNLPTNGNPTPNPTPTDVPPSPTPTPTQSSSPTPSPTTTTTPSPTPTSGGGGGGGGGGATTQWWDLGFAYYTSSASNVQVGADIDGNVYVSYEEGGKVYITENDGVGAKASRTTGGNFTFVGSFTGSSHSLFVPQDTSKTIGVAYQNTTALTVQKGVKSGSTWGFSNFTTVGGTTPSGLCYPSLYMSGNEAYTSYGFSDSGTHKVGVTNFTLPSTGGTTYTTWGSTPPMGSVTGQNATISKGTNLNMGYYNGSTYNIGSYNGSGWTNYSSSGIGVNTTLRNAQTTTNGTTPFALFYKSGGTPDGWNLWYYNTSSSYYMPSGNPSTITTSSSNTCGKPIVANGKKTVAYYDSSTSTIFVSQNSDCSAPWSNIGSFGTTGSSFGVGSTANGAPIVSYQSQNAGYNAIRTQVYSSTTPKVVAQREFMRATLLCCYMGVKLPMPRL